MSTIYNNNTKTTMNTETVINTETITTTANIFTGNMTQSKIMKRCMNAIEEGYQKYDLEAKTQASEGEKSMSIGWEQAKQKGQWIIAKDAIRIDTLEQEHTEVGGYMCNPINTKMLTVYRKGKLPKGTWMDRKRNRTYSAHSDAKHIDKIVKENLTRTCEKCLDKRIMTSGTSGSKYNNVDYNGSNVKVEISTTGFDHVGSRLDLTQSRSSSDSPLDLESELEFQTHTTQNLERACQEDLAGIIEQDGEEGGSSFPRQLLNVHNIEQGQARINTFEQSVNNINLTGRNLRSPSDFETAVKREDSNYATFGSDKNFASTTVTKVVRTEYESLPVNTKPIVIQSSKQEYSVSSKGSRNDLPRDYRDGAMIYQTAERVEKARLADLNSSGYRNTKFEIESRIIAQGEVNDM